jgi:hypothetical protein
VTPFLNEAVKTLPINEIFLTQLPAIQLVSLAESLCGGEGVDQVPIFQWR